MRWSKMASLALMLIATGCAPAVHVTELGGTYPPRPESQDVAVYSTKTPTCAYRELAIITAYQGELGGFMDLDTVLAALKERAQGIGADAVVGVRLVNRGGDSPRDGYSGTAIRFDDETCMH
jgi:hypothetical protein